MGIFNRGNSNITIRNQSVDTDDDGRSARAAERISERIEAAARRNPGRAHDGVSNTGTGSVTITNSTVGGKHIARRTIR
jgi:hypothetical protein